MTDRTQAVRDAVESWSSLDPSGWNTGLSNQGARLAMKTAARLVLDGELGANCGEPPSKVVIWCASNVFTAPLEWTALFTALGSEVLLKSSSQSPLATKAMAESFSSLNVSAHQLDHVSALELLEGADALLAFGADETLSELEAQIPNQLPRSMHGHRISVAVVSGRNPDRTAEALAWDMVLYDGRGCMSPVAIFCLDETDALAAALADALEAMGSIVPPGPMEPWQGPRWRERTGLARALGTCREGSQWAVCHTAPSPLGPTLPRLAVLHDIDDIDSLAFLRNLPLSTCATDLEDNNALAELGFHRICVPGDMQRPPLGRLHDGVNVIAHLSKPR